jgi:hypothetical protein
VFGFCFLFEGGPVVKVAGHRRFVWRRVHREGLDDEATADLMTEAVACVAAAKRSRQG